MPVRYRRNWNTTPKQRQNSFQRFARGAHTAMGLASTALKVAQGVASLVNTEKKFVDIAAAATGVNTTPAINCLTAVSVGTGVNNRIGNSIKATTLNFRGDINWSAYTAGGARVRIMLIRDLIPNNGSTPTASQILQSTANAQMLMQSFINLTFGKRFSVLYDKIFTQTDTHKDNHIDWFYKFATTTTQTHKISKKTNPHVTFTSSGATDTDAGHVYCVVMGDQTANLPTLSYNSRLRYIDN